MSGAIRAVFFTGGTALAPLSRELARQEVATCHIVTTFDSGGSSGELRKIYNIPAVGDLRNRLLALADPCISPEIIDFCAMRLDKNAPRDICLRQLLSFGQKSNPVWGSLPADMAKVLWRNLNYFLERLSPEFDPRGACMGNLLLAGAYLEHGRRFEAILAIFGDLLRCRGAILPVTECSWYLGARLANGLTIVGQHLFKNLPAPVERLFLSANPFPCELDEDSQCRPALYPAAREYIANSPLLCFPMGSFYSSVLANLLPAGVGRAVAKSGAVKIFIPDSGHDPELCGLNIGGQAERIIKYLRKDAPLADNGDLLNIVLIDSKNGRYPGGVTRDIEKKLESLGVGLMNRPIVRPGDPQKHDPAALLAALEEISANGA